MSVDVLATIRPLVGIIAREHTATRPDLYDDAVQEGMIAAWEAADRATGDARKYAVVAARNGVRSVLRGRPATGSPGHQGRQDAHDHATFYDAAVDVEYADPTAETALRNVEWAAHTADVEAAINALPDVDRTYVIGRFYFGMTGPEIAETVGVPNATLHRRFTTFTVPRLAAALSHLADAA